MSTIQKIMTYKVALGSLMMSMCLSACSLNIPLEDEYSDPDAVATVENARSLLTSGYIAYPHYEYEFSVLGPDFCPTSLLGKDSDLKNLYNWQDNAINKLSEGMWLDLYYVISVCDILQERLPMVTIENEADQKEWDAIRAESLTLEAMSYFNLLRIFAPAYDQNPSGEGIVLKNRIGVEFPKRSSKEDCVKYIRGLLQEAALVDHEAERNGWLSQTAAQYLQAELELYAGNYAAAAEYAEAVLKKSSDVFFIKMGYRSLWEEPSCMERIFAWNLYQPIYVSLEYDREQGDYLMVSPEITYNGEDYREEFNCYPFTMEGEERNLFGKYNLNNKTGRKNTYLNAMRYSGAYFIAAEAYSHLEGMGGKARQLMNEYLEYCHAELLPETLDGDALTQAIIQEKLKEFVGEGVVYFDYKRLHRQSLPRYNKWGKMTTTQIDKDNYRWTFPIPKSEYKNNQNVNQNEGWPMTR